MWKCDRSPGGGRERQAEPQGDERYDAILVVGI
jgi:hypothetical protein